MSLVPFQSTVLEDPLFSYNISSAQNSVPRVVRLEVGLEGGVFFFHSRTPMRIGECGLN
jgi:hypothetical protein